MKSTYTRVIEIIDVTSIIVGIVIATLLTANGFLNMFEYVIVLIALQILGAYAAFNRKSFHE